MVLTSFFVFLLSPAFATDSWATFDFKPLREAISACHSALIPDAVLVVGLGNVNYSGTRHNRGDDLVRALAKSVGARAIPIEERWLTFDAESDAAAEEYVRFSGASSPSRDGATVRYRVGGEVLLPPSDSRAKHVIFARPFYDINDVWTFCERVGQ